MKWSIKEHGDWLEKEAADFITNNISAYEETWKLYIGHQGNGIMANMTSKLTDEEEGQRRAFAQHHYTILESLFLMQCASNQEQVHSVKSFDDYRVAVNNIMLFQAHAGRLRDNFSKCFELLYDANKAGECNSKLEAFYNGRHIFLHGKKVPFSKDELGLMKLPLLKVSKVDPKGFGADMLWEDAKLIEFQYTADYMKQSMVELCQLAQGLLQDLLNMVKKCIKENGWTLESPNSFSFSALHASASGDTAAISYKSALSTASEVYNQAFTTSGVVNYPHISNFDFHVKPTVKSKRRGGKNRK